MVTNQLRYLLRRNLDVKERIEYFLKYHEKFSKGAVRLAEWSFDYCDAILNALSSEDYRRRFQKSPKRVENILLGLKELGLLLRYFETSSEDQIPVVFIKHFEKALQKIKPRDSLIIRPNNSYDYKAKMLGDRLESILSYLPSVFAETTPSLKLTDENILLIGFPKHETLNCLTNSLMGHEFGHYIYAYILKAEKRITNEFVRNRENYKSTVDSLLKQGIESYDEFRNLRIERLVANWIKESFCDWFGMKFMGPTYYFALLEYFLGSQPTFRPLRLDKIDHPDKVQKQTDLKEYRPFFAYLSPAIRCHLLLEHYQNVTFTYNELECLGQETIHRYDQFNLQIIDKFSNDEPFLNELQFDEYKVAYNWVKEFFESDLFNEFESELSKFHLFYEDDDSVPELWYLLTKDVTPNALLRNGLYQDPADWRSILYASWLYLVTGEIGDTEGEDLFESNLRMYGRYAKFREIVGESLEMAFLHHEYLDNKRRLSPVFPERKGDEESKQDAGVLMYDDFISKKVETLGDKVVVSPILDRTQLGTGSIDLRLGHDFILFNRATGILKIDPIEKEEIEKQLHKYHTRIRLGFGEPLYLHPGELILARTFEYIRLPARVAADVVGRSSLGRLGPIIATAPRIHPGFNGTITLEIVNLGNVPVVLYPCLRVAQLVLYNLGSGGG